MPGTSVHSQPRASTRLGMLALVLGAVALLVAWGFLHPELTAAGRVSEASSQGDFPAAPTAPAAGLEPVSARLAAVLLQAADLGAGWFDQARPNPALVRRADLAPRVEEAATARFVRSRRTATGWVSEGAVSESVLAFASEPGARVYLLRQEAEASASCRCTQTWVPVDGTPVVWTTRGGAHPTRRASFVVRETALTVVSSDTTAAVFREAVEAAVRRAAA